MSSRRQILEDSGDSESEGAGSSSFKFLTQYQVSEIEGCNINTDGDGTYSANAMSLAISQNEANLIELDTDDTSHDYQQYQVLKGKTDAFLSKPIWIRSGEPSEEALLLEIEALRRSSKRTKITMFKHNSKTGGQVVFGPWWNHALQRIAQISSDNSGGALDWERYTAGRILLALFAFVTESTDFVKKGKLADLKTTFGVDWDNNVKTARKVINRCATDTILDEQLTKCELHVESLRGTPPSAESEISVPSSISVKTSPHNDLNDTKKEEEVVEEKKKREDEARKKRMAAMKASQRRASAFSASIEQSRTKTDPAPSAATSAPVPQSISPKTTEQPPQDSVPQNDTENRMRPPPPRFIPPAQPVVAQTNQFHTANKSTLYSSLTGDTKVDNANISFVSQDEYSRGQSHQPNQQASFVSSNQKNQNSRARYEGSRDDDSREKDYRSQYAPREDKNYRYNDRTRSDRYERPYSRDNSREHKSTRNHGSSRDYNDERPQKRFRGPRESEQRSTSYVSSASNGVGSETRQSPQEPQVPDNGNVRHEKLTAFTAPGAGRGRGRGGVDNRPAWMTHGQNSLSSHSNTLTSLPTTSGKESAADHVTAKLPTFTAPVPSAGRGRGRGGVDNRPAWITKGLTASNTSSTKPIVEVTESVSDTTTTFDAPVASVGRGRGRGRGRGGIDNRPAWMSKTAATLNTVPKPSAGGMGRGRGRGIDNRPAWMSQQDKNN